MTDISIKKSIPITELMNNLQTYRYNPHRIQKIILDHLDAVTNGDVDIVDPTNPFVFLLEASTVNTALATNEALINLRRQYPILAQTEDELYLHMSDKDFVDRFAVPAETTFTMMFQVDTLTTNMVYDPIELCHKVCIPRDTEFSVAEMVYTTQYPIYIRKYQTGLMQVMYDTEIASPLQVLSSNIIDYHIRTDANNINYMFFSIPVKQFAIDTAYFNTQSSTTFNVNIPFLDQFYYARVFQRNARTNNKWQELHTTHTEQVFDPFNPSAVFKVYSNSLDVYIPAIYVSNGSVAGDIRIDVYSTKGRINVNLGTIKADGFGVKIKPIDEVRDLTPYVTALNQITYFIFNKNMVVGGTNGIDFNTLRERVIFNSVGDTQIPITNIQIEAYVNNRGFDLVKNVDVVTNRIFLATKVIPDPLEPKLATAANIGIAPFISSLESLKEHPYVIDNTTRYTVLSKNLYLNQNGKLSLVPKEDIDVLNGLSTIELANAINQAQYLRTPFYYVLDSSSSEFEVRAYNLDYPSAGYLSFISQNQTLQLPVNTSQYLLTKETNGYKLTITTKSGNYYKLLADGQVDVQLGYYPDDSSNMAYIDGVLVQLDKNGDRVFSFDIETNHDINASNLLCITNSKMNTGEYINGWVNLNTEFHIFYTTTSVTVDYKAGEADLLIGTKYLPNGSVAITHESIKLTFGSALKNLWVRSRTFASGMTYLTYPADIPLVYTKDIYDKDPVTGSIFTIDEETGELVYHLRHRFGDTALDDDGNVIYQHRKGDIMLDMDGLPIIATELISDVEYDVLFVDAKYYFATDAAFVRYRGELTSTIDTWITKDLLYIQDVLLEQTKIFFYSKTSLVNVKVLVDSGLERQIPAEQSLIVNLYVKNDVYSDEVIRHKLRASTIKLLDDYVKGLVVNLTDITIALKQLYGDLVTSLSITGLGGEDNNYNIVTLVDTHNRLVLRKRLAIQEDGSTIVEEDVVLNFYNIEKPIVK